MKIIKSQKQETSKIKKRIALTNMARIVYIRHSLLNKYNLHIIQYCLLVFLIRVSTKYEYCKIKKGIIAKFLGIPANTFTYHFKELKKKRFLEEDKGLGIKICNDECKKDLSFYDNRFGTYNIIDYQLIEELDVTHFQYCILHSVYITKHFTKNLTNTSIQTLAQKLNGSHSGIDQALKKLEKKKYLTKGIGSQITLSELVLKIFDDLHDRLNNDPTTKIRRGYGDDTL